MDRKLHTGSCDTCGEPFGYYLVHGGFNDSSHAYCGACGTTAILDYYSPHAEVLVPIGEPLPTDAEAFVQPCPCGGKFSGSASPRCPRCKAVLSPDKAATWIEAGAPGTKKGWRWPRTWQGLYCIVIENRLVTNNWDLPAAPR